jgi:hypothetical protein
MTARVLLGALFAAAIVTAAACSDSALKSVAGPSAGIAASSDASLPAGVRMVTGSAEVEQMPGAVYRNTIDGKKYPDGTVTGTLVAQISDLSAFGGDKPFTVVHRIDCLEFSEDSVWFGAEITSASSPEAVAGIERAIGQIKKIDGQDYLFSGPAQFYVRPGVTCADRPTLPLKPARQGQFSIR